MKRTADLFISMLCIAMACEEGSKPIDPIYEFIAFKGPAAVSLNESVHSTTAYPMVIELKAFEPYNQDLEVSYEIDASNAEMNTDFTVTPAGSITIPAGKLISDTIYVKTIDNDAGTALERAVNIRITSVSEPGIKIGLGIQEPKKALVTLNILDDECSETTSVFNSSSLVNMVNWGDGEAQTTVNGVLVDDALTVTGDLIAYGTFPDASVTITLTPQSEGATKGAATFGEQVAGTDNDGWEYKFVQTGEGTYDVCSGVVSVAYDIYYLDGGNWVYWYSVTNEIALP